MSRYGEVFIMMAATLPDTFIDNAKVMEKGQITIQLSTLCRCFSKRWQEKLKEWVLKARMMSIGS